MLNRVGTIVSLQLCVGHRKPMSFVQSAEVIEGLGLKGDRHAIAESTRQILLIEEETLNALDLKPGEVKENITTRGLNLMGIQRGEKLHAGNGVVLEITKPCSPCGRMDEIRSGLQRELAGRRGMLVKVIRGGTINLGDTIRVL
jgi:MOSC domain-containing protein YiiM